jgi:hypothetical protein
LLPGVTKAPRKSLVDWIVQVLTGVAEAPPASRAHGISERLEPVRRPCGRKRRENQLDSSRDDPPRQKR